MELLEIPWYVSVLLTLLTSGVLFQIVSSVYFRRQKRLKETGDAISASSGTVDSVTSVSDAIANRYEEAMKKLVEVQGNYYKEVLANTELSSRVEKLERTVQIAEYERKESQRRLNGMERVIKAKLFAQQHICLIEECPKRKPKLGTYKDEDELIRNL